MIRKISAGLIFPVSQVPIKNGIICLDHLGFITEIISPVQSIDNIERLEYFDGVLIPAFISENRFFETKSKKSNSAENIFLKEYLDFVRDTLKTIYNHQSISSFHNLLKKYTIERAIELNLEQFCGSLELGKKPGIIQICSFNFKNLTITEEGDCKIISIPQFNIDI